MKKIKIMHFVSGFKNGGVEQVILNYTSLLNQNYNVQEVIVYQHEADKKKLELSKQIGNVMYRVPFKMKHPIGNLVQTYKIIKKEKPDIVHAHMNLVNFFPLFVAKLLGIPVRICHSHIAKDNINPKLAPLFKKLNLKFANKYMACGLEAGKYMFGKKHFDILYNAIDINKYKFNLKNRNEIRNKYNISDDTILLGNIGRIVKQKNQKFLIDIFSDYLKVNKKAILMIIGCGSPKLEKELEEYIKVKKCSNKIIRIDGVKSTEKYYSAFDVFMLPSLYEGLPVVGIEAQASGVTTLLSNHIDPTTVYSQNTKLLPINLGTQAWVRNIDRNTDRKKKTYKRSQYNINIQYPKLYEYYKNALKGE